MLLAPAGTCYTCVTMDLGKKKQREHGPVPEVLPVREQSVEHRTDAVETISAAPASEAPLPIPAPAPVALAPVAMKDPQLQEIESVLSEGLGDLYTSLTPDVQQRFKAKGEEVAQTIQGWVLGAKLVAKQVLRLIREWLAIAPGTSRFYLEQESKIKTDRIMHLAESGDLDSLV